MSKRMAWGQPLLTGAQTTPLLGHWSTVPSEMPPEMPETLVPIRRALAGSRFWSVSTSEPRRTGSSSTWHRRLGTRSRARPCPRGEQARPPPRRGPPGAAPPARGPPGTRTAWTFRLSRARFPHTLTFCSSAEAASGISADIALPLQMRCREKMRLGGGRDRPAAAATSRAAARPRSPRARRGQRRPRKWPPLYDDTEPLGALRSPGRPPAPPLPPDAAARAPRCRSTSFLPSKVAARASPHIRLWLPSASWEL
ncbi:uncharacterized protein [Dasypus novemcinctus]|uniref:uncharacterized protein n=1 Tax=Dasypus novemcinctus TaxID=9361 RepID=UPI0039C8CF6C